jgi:hypothetical protein
MMRTVFSTRKLMLLSLVLLSLVLGACQQQPQIPDTGQSISVKAADFSFEAPDQIQAGPVTITLDNTGQESHHVQLVRLNDGVTLEQFQAALQEGEEAALPLVTFQGGVASLSPGKQGQVTLDLEAGQYLLLCFIPSADGVPHLAKGMIKPVSVVAGEGEQPAMVEPEADVTVTLKDFTFEMPAHEIQAGAQAWKISNAGPQIHELAIIKLAEGKTLEDVAAFTAAPSGPPPFEEVGGMQALSPNASGWVNLDLQAGEYAMLCFVPDFASGKPHVELGMLMPFSVK